MRIATVVGHVTLNRSIPSFHGASLKLSVPLTLSEIEGQLQSEAAPARPQGDSIVVWDELGSGQGSLIAVSEGPEASQPFRPERKPVDAYAAAILDTISLTKKSSTD